MTDAKLNGWLVHRSGSRVGTRNLLAAPVTRIGRDPSNDIVISGEESRVVSSRHLEIRLEGARFKLCDLGSTNGTYVNGTRVTETPLEERAVVQLGGGGPEFLFETEVVQLTDLDATMPMAALPVPAAGTARSAGDAPIASEDERLLSEAVQRAREARRSGAGDQTGIIMREVLGKAIHRSGKKSRRLIVVLAVALIGISAYAVNTHFQLRRQKNRIDSEIVQIEGLMSRSTDPQQLESLIVRLQQYQEQAMSVQRNLLYRLGVRNYQQDYVEKEIKSLLAEFGAEEYSIPPEFMVQVNRFIRQYQEQDRPHMERILTRSGKDLEIVRAQLESDNLPPDLAYMTLVESAFISSGESAAGAAGLWQFTPDTARAYGMKVDGQVDERLDTKKSTVSASRYIRELILEFGAGSSVMLALAAYNVGPTKVRRAVRDVSDPIKQRNFWYLYRVRALPVETREYIPKIFAAMIIGRAPEQFGF